MVKLTNELIAAAILGFEEQKRRIDGQIEELRSLQAGSPAAPKEPERARKMTAAGRKAIAQAQKDRWAKIHAAKAAAAEPPVKKRTLTAKGRRNIIAALKKRHAMKRMAAGA
jgi:hypothetical protein